MMRHHRFLPRGSLLLLAAFTPACNHATGPALPEADVRILFVGNSLTYVNGMPAMVATVADVAGLDVAVETIARPDFSLEDHWRAGIAADIRALSPDILVMQQGPSSLPENQLHLRQWSDSLARIAREVGAEPALLMVWPSSDREFAFDDVRESYRAAAEHVGGVFIPAGEAWRAVWAREPQLILWGPDGFHPAPLGSVVTALTVARTLLEVPLSSLPGNLEPSDPDLPPLLMGTTLATLVYAAVEETVSTWGVRQ
jgi:hypothetical protein